MIVKNNSKAVIVLKAVGLQPLRLFPGYNTVSENDIGKYFEGNPAAAGHKKMSLSVVEGSEMTAEDKVEADKAKEKNELLNKAQRVIQQNKKEMSKNNKTMAEQADLISEQGKIIEDLQAKMEKLEVKMDKESAKGKDKK